MEVWEKVLSYGYKGSLVRSGAQEEKILQNKTTVAWGVAYHSASRSSSYDRVFMIEMESFRTGLYCFFMWSNRELFPSMYGVMR